MSQLQPQQQQQTQQTADHPTMNSSIGRNPFASPTSERNVLPRRMRPFPRRRKLAMCAAIPESSIHDYARWIEEKGDQKTEQEQKFLWKYQKRLLIQQDKLSTENLKAYVHRLLLKEERTEAEDRLIRQYHRRTRRKMKRDGKEETAIVVWQRVRPVTIPTNPLATQMASLKESMDKMGLSAQKLRDVEMES